jgi:hypothetical protein
MPVTIKKITTNISDTEMDRIAKENGEKIKAESGLVTIRIPKISKDPNRLDDNDKVPVPVTVNGYTWYIKRGEKVEVPKVVEDILEEAGYLG